VTKHEDELLEALIDAAASRSLAMSLSSFRRLCRSLDVQRAPGRPWSSLSSWKSLLEAVRARRPATAQVVVAEMLRPIHAGVQNAFVGRYPPDAPSPVADVSPRHPDGASSAVDSAAPPQL
jgi:hypothetical protein